MEKLAYPFLYHAQIDRARLAKRFLQPFPLVLPPGPFRFELSLAHGARFLDVVDLGFMVLLRFVERGLRGCNRALAALPGRIFLLGLTLSLPLLFLEVEGGLAGPLVIDGLGSRLAHSRSWLL